MEDESISSVEEKLAARAKKNFIFRGTITIPNFNGSEFTGKTYFAGFFLGITILDGTSLQIMGFEKAFASYRYQAIEIPKKDFASEALMVKMSRSINETCDLKVNYCLPLLPDSSLVKGLDFSGITIDSKAGSIIVILAI